MLHKYLDMDVMFSISGPVTYANADRLRETVAGIPMERLLIETDCPYLTPAPHRGKRNDPTHVAYVAQKIAENQGQGMETSARHIPKRAAFWVK
jgi:TatD DNase family protein